MKVVKKYPDNTFCGINLTTTNLAGAETFYTGLFGWEIDYQPLPDGGSDSNFQIDGFTVAGVSEIPEDMGVSGVSSAWNSYVKHSDIDSVAARVAGAGGEVPWPPMDLMEQGRLALIQDRTGAPFALWQPGTNIGAQVVNQPNTWVWNALLTRDLEAARDFYGKVFGWTAEVDSESGYTSWYQNGRLQCGGMAIQDSWGDTPPHWEVYFLVDDLDATTARVVELGGAVVQGPWPAGNIGRTVVVKDPQGAVFSLIEYSVPADEPPGVE